MTTKPPRDARGRFVGNRRTISAWVPPDEHPADVISVQPQRPHHCGICHLEKTPDAWLYCDACADRREAEYNAAQEQADGELHDTIRFAVVVFGLATAAFVATVLCVWWGS